MQLVFDGETIDLQSPTESEVLAIIDRYLESYVSADRLIDRCLINAFEIADFAQIIDTVRQNLQAGTLERVEVTSISRRQLFQEVSRSASEYVDRLLAFIQATSIQIQSGSSIDLSEWNLFIDGLEWLMAACTSIVQQVDLITPYDQDINSSMFNINASLVEILTAFENEDYILLSDLLEYELAEQLTSLKNALMAGRAQGNGCNE